MNDYVINPATGRRVKASGRIGRKVLAGSHALNAATATNASALPPDTLRIVAAHSSPTSALNLRRTSKAMRNAVNATWEKASLKVDHNDRHQPLTAAEIVEQMPDRPIPASYMNKQHIDIGKYLVMMKNVYGEGLTLLTRKVAKQLVGKKPIFAIWGGYQYPFLEHVKRTDPKDMLMLEFLGRPSNEKREKLLRFVPRHVVYSGYLVRNINPNLPKNSLGHGYFGLRYSQKFDINIKHPHLRAPVEVLAYHDDPLFVFLKPTKFEMRRKKYT